MGVQRTAHNNGSLSEERIAKLLSVNFVFDICDERWNVNFNLLSDFIQKNGHSLVPKSESVLCKFTCNLRKRGQIYYDQTKIDKLNQINFIFNAKDAKWELKYDMLVEFIRKNGPNKLTTKNNRPLIDRMNHQKRNLREGNLSKVRFDKLSELGVFIPKDSQA